MRSIQSSCEKSTKIHHAWVFYCRSGLGSTWTPLQKLDGNDAENNFGCPRHLSLLWFLVSGQKAILLVVFHPTTKNVHAFVGFSARKSTDAQLLNIVHLLSTLAKSPTTQQDFRVPRNQKENTRKKNTQEITTCRAGP